MRRFQCFLFIGFFLMLSCKDKDFTYYFELYHKNKEDYVYVKNNMYNLLNGNNWQLFKYEVEFTGKLFNQYSYSTDTTLKYIDNIKLGGKERDFCQNFMYKQNLNYIVVYKDSTIYYYRRVFKGISQLIMYEDGIKSNLENARQIDSNVYYRFVED